MSFDDRLDALLDAAYTCFTRHGVARTTMDDLAREAGMSRPAVYQHVRNKQDVYRRLVDRMLQAALAASRADSVGQSSLTAQLDAALQVKLALVSKVWADGPAHAAELLGADARLSADLIASYDAAMRDLLADLVHAAHPDADAGEVALLLLALTRGLEADLSDPAAPAVRLRRGVALVVAGLDAGSTHPKGTP